MADRVAAGKRARTSGHNFERKIVRLLKERFADRPWCKDIRRTDQSHFAVQPDVTGLPGLWIECQSAQPHRADPAGKLAQATRDCHGFGIPVAVINRKSGDGSRRVWVYLTLASLLRVLGVKAPRGMLQREPKLFAQVTAIELAGFLDLYDAGPVPSVSWLGRPLSSQGEKDS